MYRLTSPSGRTYVGYTGQEVDERLRQHVQRARKRNKHPLSAALRKYGSEAFQVEILSQHNDLMSALLAEKVAIAAEPNAYNLSAGGETDHLAGHARFRELLSDPVWRAAYAQKLSAALKASPYREDQRARMAASGARWRAENPREAYKNAMRALRMGRRAKHVAKEEGRLPRKPKSKAAKLHKSRASAEAARRHWASMDETTKKEIQTRISQALARNHAEKTAEERSAHRAQLAKARERIDHTVRKTRQKEALASYWTPERRAEASRSRKERYAALSPEEKAARRAFLAGVRNQNRKGD